MLLVPIQIGGPVETMSLYIFFHIALQKSIISHSEFNTLWMQASESISSTNITFLQHPCPPSVTAE
jgi:hypothetical protein